MTALSKEPLNDAWTIVPVGGADKVPTFVALLGAHVDVTVLIDASTKGNQRLADLANRGLLDPKRILTPAHILGTSRADIEDLFAPAEYLQLFNAAFGTSFSEADIPGTDPITRRLARHLGHDFSHDRPATELLRNKIDILAKLGSDTLTRFERLFNAINATLSPPD